MMNSFLFLCAFALCSLTSCYQMPDDEFCVVPTTNNPSVTHAKKNTSPVPSVGF